MLFQANSYAGAYANTARVVRNESLDDLLWKLTYRPFEAGNIVKPIYFDSKVYEQDIVCNFKQIQRTEGMYRIASCGECSDCLDPDQERFYDS